MAISKSDTRLKSMNYSIPHQNFSYRMNAPEALERPEYFLGSNYATILNFWWYLEGLTETQVEIIDRRYRERERVLVKLSPTTRANYASAAAVSHHYIKDAAWNASFGGNFGYSRTHVAGWATYELMGMHLLLQQGDQLVFVPMFSNL
jgi:hypothetical protein